MNIDYKKIGDYLLPNLVIENQNYGEINKYGLLRLEYIKERKKRIISDTFNEEQTNKSSFFSKYWMWKKIKNFNG